MKARDVMTAGAAIVSPDTTILDAAKTMAESDVGILLVGKSDRLVGMITDRDIAIRGVAQGRDPVQTRVGELMTGKVLYCYDDEEVGAIASTMSNLQIRRLPVVNRNKRLMGVLSLGDIALKDDAALAGATLHGVCLRGEAEPGAPAS
ncbi:MAG TPA: CBS domain-containing protein [Stellaceae bacterium]|jgi:CBS domain-containing protein|nr:CBS domain-containing protein [Stellaceae bacterium]